MSLYKYPNEHIFMKVWDSWLDHGIHYKNSFLLIRHLKFLNLFYLKNLSTSQYFFKTQYLQAINIKWNLVYGLGIGDFPTSFEVHQPMIGREILSTPA